MDPTFIVLILGLAVFIVFQVFQGRKRRAETLDRQTKFVPGVEIMTNYGLYGTILDMDEDTNVVTIESTPGTVLKIHRQTILKVADYAVVADSQTVDGVATGDVVGGDSNAGDVDADDVAAVGVADSTTRDERPLFGERSVSDQAPAASALDDDRSAPGHDGGSSRTSRPLDGA